MQGVMPGTCLIMLVAALLAAVHGASIDDCGDSTFINQSSGGSPKVTDCQKLAENIAIQERRTDIEEEAFVTEVLIASNLSIASPEDLTSSETEIIV